MGIADNTGKWLYLLIFALIHFQIPANSAEGEEYSIIEKDHKKGLVNKRGRVLIPPEYDDLGWTNGGTRLLENVIGFKKDGLWGVLNTKNEKVTDPVYTSLARFNESWIIASKKLPYNSTVVYGVINARGNAEIAFQYHKLIIHHQQLIGSVQKGGSYIYGILDDRAKPVLPFEYDRIKGLTENLYEVTLNDQVSIFNHQGDKLTDFNLDSTRVLDGKYVLTYRDGKTGIISDNGTVIIDPKYKNIIIESGKIKGEKLRKWKVYNNEKQHLRTYTYDNIVPKGVDIYRVKIGEAEALIHSSDSLLTAFANFEIQDQFGKWISIQRQGKSGIIDFSGDMFLDPVYDSIRFDHNLFIVRHKRNGKRGWSLINNQGKVLTDQVYDRIEWLGASYYQAKRDDYWGVINNLGKEIIFCKYDSIVQYSEGKLLVDFLGEDGILNLDGNWEILPQEKEIEIVDPMRYLVRSPYGSYVAYYPGTKDFTAEYFLYRRGKRYLEKTLDMKYGLRDEDGKRIIRPDFKEISDLQEDSLYIALSDNGYSFITKSGKIMVKNDKRFQAVNDMTEEFIGVKIDGKWGFVDINGKLRVANQYDNIGPYNEGLAPIKLLGRWGYIDKREKLIVQPTYDTVYNFQGGLCVVIKKGKYGLINAKGETTLECEYDRLYRLNTGGFLTEKDNKFGLVGAEGRLLILPKFDQVLDLNNGYVIASRKGKYGLLSDEGVNILPMVYEQLKYDQFNNVYLAAHPTEWEEINLNP